MQNRDGVDEAFELRGQHDVHEDEGQREGEREVVAGAAQFLGGAGEAGAVAGLHAELLRLLVQLLDDGRLRSAGHQVGGDRHLALAADAVDGRGSGAGNDAHHLVEAHGTELLRRHGHLGQALDAAAELLLGADHHIVLVVARVEGGGRLAGDQGVERLLDIHHADAEIGGARTIDLQAHFRLAGAQRGIGIHQGGVGPHLGEQRLGIRR